MSSQQSAISPRPGSLSKTLHDHWGVFLAEGIILCVLGLAAMLVPLVAGLVTTVFLGWLFMISGAVSLIATFRTRSAAGFAWSLISALLAILVGASLLFNPVQGLFSLTILLATFFAADGILMIVLAFIYRRKLSGKWEWMMVNGVVDLGIAAFVISGLPGSIVWTLGLIIGIDMVFGGGSLIAMALAARKDARN
jgi:uncharacterized membrane protein HdeD (DUF308 family)